MSVSRSLLELRRRAAEIRVELGSSTPAVFVIGAPRSGTTDLAWALSAHPDLWTGGDSNVFYSVIGPDRQGRSKLHAAFAGMSTMAYPEFASLIGRGFDRLFLRRSRGKRWIDSASENALVAEDLSFMFPEARFLHVVRDGRAVVRSARSGTWPIAWAATLRGACEVWSHFAREGIAFRERHPERVLEVRIEEVARAPEEACERILDFLGAQRSDEPARAIRANGLCSSYEPPRAEFSGFDVPEDGDWERWEAEERTEFLSIAGGALRSLGYESGSSVEKLVNRPPGH